MGMQPQVVGFEIARQQPVDVIAPIIMVTQQRVSSGSKVPADLVLSARLQAYLYQGEGALGWALVGEIQRKRVQGLVMRAGSLHFAVAVGHGQGGFQHARLGFHDPINPS